MPELGIHQGDDGIEDFQSLPSSREEEIDSNDVGRSVEPQAEEDVRNSGKELVGGVTPDLTPISIDQVFVFGFVEMLAAMSLCSFIHGALTLLVVLYSYSFPGEFYMNQPANLHEKISEMRIVETPLHSVRSVAQFGTQVFKVARHDFLLLRTGGDQWYKAEKRDPSSQEQAGIHLDYRLTGPGVAFIKHQSNISLDFSFFNLTDHDLDHSLWVENYWKYIRFLGESALSRTLNLCIDYEIASDDDNKCNGLKETLENLADIKRSFPIEVVDIDEPWNILWGVLSCFLVVFGRFWLGFCMDWNRRPTVFHEKMSNHSIMMAAASHFDLNPIVFTYNLTWLATTYLWHFNFLSFFGYYVGWTVFLRGVESWILELEKHSEDPCLTTGVSGRENVEITNLRTNSHQDDSMVNQRKKRPSRTLLLGLFILILVTTFEQALGYSIYIVCLRWVLVYCGLRATKGFSSMADLRGEVRRYVSRARHLVMSTKWAKRFKLGVHQE